MSTDTIKCMACGTEEHAHLIDAKPEAGADPETSDFTRLECVACFGPGWNPCGGPDDFALSIAPHLKPHYEAWLAAQAEVA